MGVMSHSQIAATQSAPPELLESIRAIVRHALDEDLGDGDVTTVRTERCIHEPTLMFEFIYPPTRGGVIQVGIATPSHSKEHVVIRAQ